MIRLLISCLAFLVAASALPAQERLALIIGNGGYGVVEALDNPPSDAQLMAETLRGTGFEVTLLTDADQAEMLAAIGRFGRRLRAAGAEATGLFYYAGHGVQSFGENYLLPVDVTLTDAADLPLVAVEAQAILRQMFSARNRTNIVILDACRNNPFEALPDLGDNGLAEMKAPTGTFLAYSTGPGEVALDGLGRNSPFTAALAEHVDAPGVPIEQMFKTVRVEVMRATNGRQVPWDTSSLTSDFTFVPQAAAPAASASASLWAMVRESGDPVQIELFLRAYPDSPFAVEALAMMAQFDVAAASAEASAADAPAYAAPPPPPAAPPAPPAAPPVSEQEMIGIAMQSGARADYQAYLDAYPQGTYAELAAFEIKTLDETAAADAGERIAAATAPETTPPAAAQAPTPAPLPETPVTFTAPLALGGAEVEGQTLEALIAGIPLYPPIEGLPEDAWKGQNCGACHEWQRDNLCDQAQTYLRDKAERSLSKLHPYGGGFKANLRRWAENDCR